MTKEVDFTGGERGKYVDRLKPQGELVDPNLLVPGIRVLFWFYGESGGAQVMDGEIKGLEHGKYVIEDPHFIYDVEHKDIIRIREGFPHG